MTATTTATSDARRVAGIDRRTIGPALLVLALAVLMSVVLPSIDNATSYGDEVDKGDVAEIADGLTLVPASGWKLATGALAGRTRSLVGATATTEVVDGSVELEVQTAPFDGTPSALLTRVNKIDADLERVQDGATATTRRYAVTTRQGAVRVAEELRRRPQAGDHRRLRFPLPRAVDQLPRAGEPRGRGGRRRRPRGLDLAPTRRHRRDDPQHRDGVVTSPTENRRRAIERSGFGEEFDLVQPQNLAFWVYCLLVIAGAVALSGQISIAAAAYSGALVSGVIAFGLLAVAYCGSSPPGPLHDRPAQLAAAGSVWGAVAAVGASRSSATTP